MDGKKLLLMDTGPLRELINFKAVFDLGFQNLRRDLESLTEKSSFEKVTDYIGPFQTKCTTGAVIVELHHWIRGTEPAGRGQLWSLVYDEFRDMNMEERLVRIRDMPIELVARYGPTDISLLTLAQQHVESEPVVLTSDRGLWSKCKQVDIHSVHIHEIIGGQI